MQRELLRLQTLGGNAAVQGLVAQRDKGAAAAKKSKGGAKYVGPRLETKLRAMIAKGTLEPLTDEQIYLLQGIANVESSGKTAAVNTWDNMIVSMGFKQVTLAWGSLYRIMDMAPQAFARHGIAKSGGVWNISTGQKKVPALAGVDNPHDLRSEEWQDRFIAASLDDEIIAALVAYSLKELGELRGKLKGKQAELPPQLQHPTAQAWLFEVYNNRPAYAPAAAKAALAKAREQGINEASDRFLDILAAEIERVYVTREKDKEKAPQKARNIVTKIPRLKMGGGAAKATTTTTTTTSTPATTAPNVDWGKVVGTIGSAVGGPAASLLIAMGHRDEKKLTNFLFWAAHPEAAGQKIQPNQKDLARDWLRIRSDIVRPKLAALAAGKATAATVPKAKTKTSNKPATEVGAATGDAPAAVHLTGGANRAYKLDWDRDASDFNINSGDGTLRQVFEAELPRQLKLATDGEFSAWDAATAAMEQAAKTEPAKAEALRRQLWQARQYALVETLKVERSPRYLDTKKDGKLSTYCNVYAHDMVTAMGAYLPRVWWTDKATKALQAGKEVKPVYNKTIHELSANALMAWMNKWGPSFGWSRTPDVDVAQDAANAGSIVIILAARDGGGSGHVSVVLAESAQHKAPTKKGKRSAPLQSQAGAWNFSYGDTAAGTAKYAIADSTKQAGAGVGRNAWWADKNHRSDMVVDEKTGQKVPAGQFFIHDGSLKEGVLPRP